MDLIRILLLRSEDSSEAADACKAYPESVRAYHVQLLIDAGLVEGFTQRDHDGNFTRSMVHRLTWSGHDFIDTMREETLWNKAKVEVIRPGASWTFDLLKEWAKIEIKHRLGLDV